MGIIHEYVCDISLLSGILNKPYITYDEAYSTFREHCSPIEIIYDSSLTKSLFMIPYHEYGHISCSINFHENNTVPAALFAASKNILQGA